MENQNYSVNHLAMSYGLYMGLAQILNFVIFYVMGTPFSSAAGLISYAILIAGISLSMRAYRDHHAEEGGYLWTRAWPGHPPIVIFFVDPRLFHFCTCQTD